jgi:hypothetical protein
VPLLRSTVVMGAMDEPPAPPPILRRFSLNVVLMAILAGAILRTYRAGVLQFGWSSSWSWIAGTFVVGTAVLFIIATLHLGNYPVKAWLWRAPVFAFIEALTEVSVSFGLTLLGYERLGSLTATVVDWQGSAMRIAATRIVGILAFSIALALVSTLVRLVILPRKPVHTHET